VRQLIAKGLIATLPSVLSPKGVYRAAESISAALLRGKEKRLRADVERMFPDRDAAWIADVVRRQRTTRAWVALDKTMFPRLGGDELVRLTDEEGVAAARRVCDEALAEGNGGIVYSMHYGRPNFTPFVLAHLGYPYVTVRAGTNQNALDTDAVSHAKTVGIELLEASELSAGVQAMRALKRNKLFFVLVDGGRTEQRVPVEFLGQTLPLAIGFAQLARRTGAALIAGVTYSDEPLRFRMSPVRVRIPEGNVSNEELAAELARPLEEMVSRDVGQWYGINRMFRLARRAERAAEE
jgi:lauroyl/myristoyl acyltransferase